MQTKLKGKIRGWEMIEMRDVKDEETAARLLRWD